MLVAIGRRYHVVDAMSIPHENLAAKIFARAADTGRLDAPALRQGDRVWTYRQLHDEVARVSTVLATMRVGAGNRVAVYMPDCMEAAAAILGIIYRGAIAVPVSELGRAIDIRDVLNDCGAHVVVTDKSLEPNIDAIRAEVSGLSEVLVVGGAAGNEHDFGAMVRGAAPATEAARVAADDLAFVFYSAGRQRCDGGRAANSPWGCTLPQDASSELRVVCPSAPGPSGRGPGVFNRTCVHVVRLERWSLVSASRRRGSDLPRRAAPQQ